MRYSRYARYAASSRYRSPAPRYDENTDDEYDAMKDAYLTGESSIPVTQSQRDEARAEEEEYRRNRY